MTYIRFRNRASDIIGKRFPVTQAGWRRIASEYGIDVATVRVFRVLETSVVVVWRQQVFTVLLSELELPKHLRASLAERGRT